MGSCSGTGSPCGACKFLRRKCASECVFAPYFCSETGPARFAAIHKVFGASNVAKLLLHVPVADRCEAVVTIAYEAQARIRDPVYGCVAHIFALQQQVACLEAQVMQVKAQLAQNMMYTNNSQSSGDQTISNHPQQHHLKQGYVNPISPQSSYESSVMSSEIQSGGRDHFLVQPCNYSRKRPHHNHADFGDLQALALRMTRN